MAVPFREIEFVDGVLSPALKRFNVAIYEGRHVPLLAEKSSTFATRAAPGVAGFASMRALGSAYEYMLRPIQASSDDTRSCGQSDVTFSLLARLARNSRTYDDSTFERRCGYGYGVMQNSEGSWYGPGIPESAVGHVGLMGMTLAFAVEEVGAVIAIHRNGFVAGMEGEDRSWRNTFLGMLYSDVILPMVDGEVPDRDE